MQQSNVSAYSEKTKKKNKNKTKQKKKKQVSGQLYEIGEYRIEIGKVRCGHGLQCYTYSLTHSLFQKDSIVVYA